MPEWQMKHSSIFGIECLLNFCPLYVNLMYIMTQLIFLGDFVNMVY